MRLELGVAPVAAVSMWHGGRDCVIVLGVTIPPGDDSKVGSRSAAMNRSEFRNPSFSLVRHVALNASVAAVVGMAGGWMIRGESGWLWLTMPLFWVLANHFEWWIHRFPMHRPTKLRILYHNHTLWHHHAFRRGDMNIRQIEDLSLVMLPWYTLLMVVGVAVPTAALLAWLFAPGLAGVFLVSIVVYFFVYETIHTLHHLPPPLLQAWGPGRWAWYRFLREHHHHHHRLEYMSRVNFNVTFPVADLTLGTYQRPVEPTRE